MVSRSNVKSCVELSLFCPSFLLYGSIFILCVQVSEINHQKDCVSIYLFQPLPPQLQEGSVDVKMSLTCFISWFHSLWCPLFFFFSFLNTFKGSPIRWLAIFVLAYSIILGIDPGNFQMQLFTVSRQEDIVLTIWNKCKILFPWLPFYWIWLSYTICWGKANRIRVS